jgi:hypothetical protein
LGGKIPKNIKGRVIRHWLDGLTRENIAKKDDIGAGTVTAIIQEARKQEEDQDIDLLRQVSVKLKEEGLELSLLGFAIRLKRIMEENGINEDQIESIIQDIAAYCLRHSISYDTVIQSGHEALYLESRFGIPVERIPEYIVQGKKTIDRLENQRQDILSQKQQEREERDAIRQERDAIVAEVKKYEKEIPSIKRNKELEAELDEANKLISLYERGIIGVKKDLDDARREAVRSEGYRLEMHAKWKDAAGRLTICQDELDKLKKKKQQINQS